MEGENAGPVDPEIYALCLLRIPQYDWHVQEYPSPKVLELQCRYSIIGRKNQKLESQERLLEIMWAKICFIVSTGPSVLWGKKKYTNNMNKPQMYPSPC